jgi:hypothetical protein
MRPVIKLASPEEYFHHIEAKYKGKIPVRKAEWGGQWDEIRAVSPIWTWRIRQAAKRVAGHASHDAAAAILLAMDHNVHLGEIWPRFFDERGARAYAAEVAAFSNDALRACGARDLERAAPPLPDVPKSTKPGDEWNAVLAGAPLRIRCGRYATTPFTDASAKPLATRLSYGVDGKTITGIVHVDRKHLPGADAGDVAVVLEIPLKAPIAKLRIAPVESPEGRRDKWLRAPQFIIGADGLRVTGLAHSLTIRSPLIFSWVLVADPRDPMITWLQGMVTRQTLLCKLKDGTTTVLPFEAWFPGEPAELDAGVEISME